MRSSRRDAFPNRLFDLSVRLSDGGAIRLGRDGEVLGRESTHRDEVGVGRQGSRESEVVVESDGHKNRLRHRIE